MISLPTNHISLIILWLKLSVFYVNYSYGKFSKIFSVYQSYVTRYLPTSADTNTDYATIFRNLVGVNTSSYYVNNIFKFTVFAVNHSYVTKNFY